MDDNDDHVISFEEAARRRRAVEEAQKGVLHEVKLSDAMSNLLDEEAAAEDGRRQDGTSEEGPSPADLRRIVERDFADVGGRSATPEERPRPHLVEAPGEERGGQLCSFETRECWDPAESPDDQPPD